MLSLSARGTVDARALLGPAVKGAWTALRSFLAGNGATLSFREALHVALVGGATVIDPSAFFRR